MTVELHADAAAYLAMGRAIRRLPDEIKAKAFARAMRRVSEMARTRIVRRSAEHTHMPQKFVRERTTALLNAGGHTADLVMRSNWIGLHKLGARQTSRGVAVRGRGSFAHAFIAGMASGHIGVMQRTGKSRLPIRELFAANPAHAVTNNPEVYLQVLAEVIDEVLAPRVLHELTRLLPR